MKPAGELRGRLPAGQHATAELPVVHVGSVPLYDPENWQLSLEGAVGERRLLGWRAFTSLPLASAVVDLHCAVGWSALGLAFEGVSLAALAELAQPEPDARWIRLSDGRGYDATLALDEALAGGTLLAFRLGGQPLSAAHGGPLRAVVPAKYAWKSVKWVRAIQFLKADEPGFWERRGYPADADPWRALPSS